MAEKLLSLKGITKRYGGVLALNNVDFDMEEGEVHCLVGENGSGKSTLIKIITGVVQPEKGANIEIRGNRIEKVTPLSAFRLGIHVVHQDLSLFPNATVAENIAIHNYTTEGSLIVNWKKIHTIAITALQKLHIDIPPDAEVRKLPIADQQLIAICRAIAGDARLIILDEPTASLTRKEVERLFYLIRSLKAKKVSTLFISHRLDEVLEIADRISVLKDGNKVGTFKKRELDKKKLIYLMTGKEISQEPTQPLKKGKEILRVEKLSREGEFKDVSFSLHRGEILGIIGPRGAGRTEVALCIFGMTSPDSGKIYFEGKQVRMFSNRDAIELGIAYVPENRLLQGLVLDQSIMYNLTVTNFKKVLGRLNLVNILKMKDFSKRAIRLFGIKARSVDLEARTLSGGNQQKVVLAKWILRSPKVLILDGPTVGIDVAAKESIFGLIHELSKREIAIILISDEASEVIYNSNRILLMKNGKIVDEYRPGEITEEELETKIKE